MREKVRPKMGKIDIDYQKLHDAFFKWQTKPKLTIHGDLYYEVRKGGWEEQGWILMLILVKVHFKASTVILSLNISHCWHWVRQYVFFFFLFPPSNKSFFHKRVIDQVFEVMFRGWFRDSMPSGRCYAETFCVLSGRKFYSYPNFWNVNHHGMKKWLIIEGCWQPSSPGASLHRWESRCRIWPYSHSAFIATFVAEGSNICSRRSLAFFLFLFYPKSKWEPGSSRETFIWWGLGLVYFHIPMPLRS